MNKRDFEFWFNLVALLIGLLTIVAGTITYAHATFLTRAEAAVRKEYRDQSEARMFEMLTRIEGKVDELVKEKRNE